MRIISQDCKFDIPYDEIVVEIFDCCVVGRLKKYVDRDIILGAYSTEAKAQKAMEMLRTAYTGRFVTNADVTDDFNERLQELMKGGFGAVIVKDTNDSRVEFDNLNGYFQFPKDEDVSVYETKRSKSFGEKVLNILKHKGISQRELAEKVGCTEVSMSRYISGDRVPKGPVIAKMANVLGVTTDYLIFESELSE